MKINDYYNKKYREQIEEDEKIGKIYSKDIVKIIGKIKNKKILDVGCGSGVITSFLTRDNEVWGMDISKKALEKAKHYGLKTIQYDIEKKFPFRKKQFDIIICREVFEHLINPIFTLQEIERVLNDNGILITSVPNQFNWKKRIKLLLGDNLSSDYFKGFNEWNYPHIRFFTFKGFKKFLSSGGFKINKNFSFFYKTSKFLPNSIVKKFPSLFSCNFLIEAVKIKK